MKKAISIFNYLAVVPLVIMLVAKLAPKGSDLRGFGPAFAIGIVSFLISGIFTLVGLIILFVAKKSQLRVAPTAVATVVAFIPLVFLLAAIFTGRA